MKLIIASNNRHKIREIREILGGHFRELLSMGEAGLALNVAEDGATFEENALKKAREVLRASGADAALSDDSGLMVDALGGAPGVLSARYAGQHGDDAANNRLLVSQLKEIPAQPHTAQFVSALALASPFGATRIFEGVCPGVIVEEPRGTGPCASHRPAVDYSTTGHAPDGSYPQPTLRIRTQDAT